MLFFWWGLGGTFFSPPFNCCCSGMWIEYASGELFLCVRVCLFVCAYLYGKELGLWLFGRLLLAPKAKNDSYLAKLNFCQFLGRLLLFVCECGDLCVCECFVSPGLQIIRWKNENEGSFEPFCVCVCVCVRNCKTGFEFGLNSD